MEQLVARRAHNPKVTGSSPVPATKNPLYRLYLGFFFFRGQFTSFHLHLYPNGLNFLLSLG